MSNIIERARALRTVIEKAMEEQSDAVASEAPEFFPSMGFDGKLIKAGTRINWGGVIKKAASDLWDREENAPAFAPELWADIDYFNGIRVIPEIIGAAEAFEKGEQGFWKNDSKIYKSLIDANVYTPESYPAGWEAVL